MDFIKHGRIDFVALKTGVEEIPLPFIVLFGGGTKNVPKFFIDK